MKKEFDMFEKLAEHFKPMDAIMKDLISSTKYKNPPLLKTDIERLKTEDWDLECAFEFEGEYFFMIGIGEDEETKETTIEQSKIANAIYDLNFATDIRQTRHSYEFFVTQDCCLFGEHEEREMWISLEMFFDNLGNKDLREIFCKIYNI